MAIGHIFNFLQFTQKCNVEVITYTSLHYSDVIMIAKASHVYIGVVIVRTTFVQAQIKENIQAPRPWYLLSESTGDRWISLTKGQ